MKAHDDPPVSRLLAEAAGSIQIRYLLPDVLPQHPENILLIFRCHGLDPVHAIKQNVVQDQELKVIPVIRQEPSMIGEDFAEYRKDHPGCFVRVGTGIGPALHHPKFTVDPSVLASTAMFLAGVAQKRLEALRDA